jgi:antitoxin HicB
MRAYPVNLRKDGKFILVTFPDIPEAVTQGRDRTEALKAAKDVLETAMDVYFDERRPVPAPSQPRRGQPVVAKILLLNEMLHQNVRPAELARRIGTSPQVVNRLTNIRHTSQIDGIDTALRALGKRLIVDAA